jgi:nucleotidyltransferase substrate binding protein (TIGR01987 family)
MKQQDIRWVQRFSNFEKSLNYLDEAIKIENPDMIQKAGLIQFFEICFELSWKVLKDYLEEKGFMEVKFPREVIKKAFENDLISDGHSWLKALADRNQTAHTYNEEIADQIVMDIRKAYFPLLGELYKRLKSEV